MRVSVFNATLVKDQKGVKSIFETFDLNQCFPKWAVASPSGRWSTIGRLEGDRRPN